VSRRTPTISEKLLHWRAEGIGAGIFFRSGENTGESWLDEGLVAEVFLFLEVSVAVGVESFPAEDTGRLTNSRLGLDCRGVPPLVFIFDCLS